MKQIWIKAIPWNKKIITTALESGADAVYVDKEAVEKVKALGLIRTIAPGGDLQPGKDVIEREIKNKEDEDAIVSASKDKWVIVRTTDWTIIPLENLIAQTEHLIVEVKSLQEAKVALTILEKGVDGVLVDTTDLVELKEIIALGKNTQSTIPLKVAKIKKVVPSGMGDRVCIDTCTNIGIGDGMLIGNSSAALFLVHAESISNPYVAPRPFRVNAGPVHAYIRVPPDRTRYLAELESGDKVYIVNYKGQVSEAIVGRSKIERRPLVLIEAECDNVPIACILQNAETIRLTQPDGSPKSIVELQSGDEVLVCMESAGRHFGIKIAETITEK